MSPPPSISVVVPFFDSERHIGSCIESLLNQRDVDGSFELIFVNNRSRDASISIVEGFPDVSILEEATPGAYAARNTGIEKAQAPLIAFTDADCTADRDWLQSIVVAMRDPSSAVLVGSCRYPPEASLALRILGAYENAKTEYVLNHCRPTKHFAYANNMAVRASVFHDLGLFQEWKRAADTELVHRLAVRRPDQRLVFCRSMKITHLEFLSARSRVQRLRLYSRTNAKIDSFEELGLAKRIAALRHLFRRSGPN